MQWQGSGITLRLRRCYRHHWNTATACISCATTTIANRSYSTTSLSAFSNLNKSTCFRPSSTTPENTECLSCQITPKTIDKLNTSTTVTVNRLKCSLGEAKMVKEAIILTKKIEKAVCVWKIIKKTGLSIEGRKGQYIINRFRKK